MGRDEVVAKLERLTHGRVPDALQGEILDAVACAASAAAGWRAEGERPR